jgi:hypothetical protein
MSGRGGRGGSRGRGNNKKVPQNTNTSSRPTANTKVKKPVSRTVEVKPVDDQRAEGIRLREQEEKRIAEDRRLKLAEEERRKAIEEQQRRLQEAAEKERSRLSEQRKQYEEQIRIQREAVLKAEEERMRRLEEAQREIARRREEAMRELAIEKENRLRIERLKEEVERQQLSKRVQSQQPVQKKQPDSKQRAIIPRVATNRESENEDSQSTFQPKSYDDYQILEIYNSRQQPDPSLPSIPFSKRGKVFYLGLRKFEIIEDGGDFYVKLGNGNEDLLSWIEKTEKVEGLRTKGLNAAKLFHVAQMQGVF